MRSCPAAHGSPLRHRPERALPLARPGPLGGRISLRMISRSPPSIPTYQVKVTLLRIEPSNWRRLLLPGDATFGVLHWAIQQSMGWTNSHLHAFHRPDEPDVLITQPAFEIDYAEVIDEEEVSLLDVLEEENTAIVYEYDFGDSWYHEVLVERVFAESPRRRKLECIDGARACPPEDVGGVYGYAEFLEAMGDPSHERHAELRKWYGRAFDPEKFLLKKANRMLRGPEKRFDWMRGDDAYF